MRLGIIGSRNFADVDALTAALDGAREDDLVIVASPEGCGAWALEWASENGLAHEEVPAGKVIPLCDEVLCVAAGNDSELDALKRRAEAAGKPVANVRLAEAQDTHRLLHPVGAGIEAEVG